jgi:hypothetical protein
MPTSTVGCRLAGRVILAGGRQMLSTRKPAQMPASRSAELGSALLYLLPYYGVCGLAILRAELRRRRHRARREFRHVSLRVERAPGRADNRPVTG